MTIAQHQREKLILLVILCLALSEACVGGSSTLGGGGFNGHGWFQTPDGRKVVPTGVYHYGSSIGVAGYTVDTWKLFRMIDGVYTEYSVPGGLYNAQGVSDTGYIAGISNSVPTGSAFVMDPSGNFQTLGYQSAGGDADNSGVLYGDHAPPSGGGGAFRRLIDGTVQDLAPTLWASFAMCADDSGQLVGINGTPTSTSTDSLPYAWMGPGQVVPLTMTPGDAWGCPREITRKGVVGESGLTAINYRPTLWEFKQDGNITRETLPGIGVMVKGSAVAVSDDLSIIGGDLFNGMSNQAAVIWLKNLDGTRFAQDVKPLLLAANYPLGTMFPMGVGDVSADGRCLLIGIQDKLLSPTKILGVVLDLYYGLPIGPVKKQSQGSPVSLSNKVVTAEYGDCFYIEDFDRSSGIRVVATGLSVKQGDRVSLSGTLQEINGENFVSCLPADVVVFPGVYPSPKPLTINNRQVGGEGVNGGTGLRNTGLLIKSLGKVSFIDPSGKYFVINDGTDVENGTPSPGLIVSTENLPSGVVIAPPAVGSFVCVTGISCVCVGNYPQIRPREQSDVALVVSDLWRPAEGSRDARAADTGGPL